MKEFLGCVLTSMLLGATIGAVIVTKNKEVAEYVKKGTKMVEDKVEDLTDTFSNSKKKSK
ncbi:MAG: hypothetical protein IJT25_00025 [Clostridia bacterium]|nr:hypothetical protein [Clostridia bacterium]